MNPQPFATLPEVATFLREQFATAKRFVLLYGHNGTGKTRLSVEFKNLGKVGDERDTLYFNAFTEDLFTWDNDLQGDSHRTLKLNTSSRFFNGLAELEMDTRIKRYLDVYSDFDFRILTDRVVFSRRLTAPTGGDAADAFISDIKISRGEEQLFKWCFFLAILELALLGDEAYSWVKFVYIDDPVSSLDEHNAIALANRLAQMMLESDGTIKAVISTHHALFFNVLFNELRGKKVLPFVLSQTKGAQTYKLMHQPDDTPFFHHVSLMQDLHEAVISGKLYTYHFNILRSILEKTAFFHGHPKFEACI